MRMNDDARDAQHERHRLEDKADAKSRHKEIRQDIVDTQDLAHEDAEDVIFRVEGLQDKFFEHLVYATNAIEDATTALEEERKTRKDQFKKLAIGLFIGLFLAGVTLFNTIAIERQSDRSIHTTCLAINENRATVLTILERLALRGGVTDEEEALLREFREGSLLPLDCESGGIEFTGTD